MKHCLLHQIVMVLFGCLYVLPTCAAPIMLERGVLTPLANSRGANIGLGDQVLTRRLTALYLVQYAGPVDAAQRTVLAQQARVCGYVPVHAFLVEATAAQIKQIAADPAVTWVGAYDAACKISGELATLRAARRAGMHACILSILAVDDVAEMTARIERQGGTVRNVTRGLDCVSLHADVPLAMLSDLAQQAAVQWIEAAPTPGLFNDVAVQGPRMNVQPVWGAPYNLTGKGQVIGHADTGLDIGTNDYRLHPDFTNRVRAAFALGRVNDWSDPTSGHGTHTAGSIMGNGSAYQNGRFRGTAYEAELVHQSFQTASGGIALPATLGELFIQTYTNAARIHSDSWGDVSAGNRAAYTQWSREADEFMWLHPDMLLVFAAGNEGTDANGNGVVDPGSVAPPSPAKNVLTVGAAENARPAGSGGWSANTWGNLFSTRFMAYPLNQDLVSTPFVAGYPGVAAISGRGPTADGRVKPDIIAPGTDIISSRSRATSSTGFGLYNNDYMFYSGTSMATPLSAGAAALVRQFYAERYTPAITNPGAALVKATLVNGARSLSPGQYGAGIYREIQATPRPNSVEGWGHVNIADSLFPTNGRRVLAYEAQAGTNGETHEYQIVLAGTNRLCATLAWTDYPATPGVGIKLVNDLDLEVVSPAGFVFYPNRLIGADRTNNLEGVDLDPAGQGTWTVRVRAYQLPQAPQPYALVLREDAPQPNPQTFQMITHEPDLITNLTPVTVNAIVTWNAGGISNVLLHWSVNNGAWNDTTMLIRDRRIYGYWYTNMIPGQLVGDTVRYHLTALCYDGSTVGSWTNSYKVSGGIYYCALNGGNVAPFDTWATAATGLAYVVAFAPAGAKIVLSNGTYMASAINIFNKSLIGEAGPRATIIDAALNNYGVGATNALISGVTVRRGSAGTYGAGLRVSDTMVSNCIVCDNIGLSFGAGAYLVRSTMSDCVVSNNTASMWGAGGVLLDSGNNLLRCEIVNNTCKTLGGGIGCVADAVNNIIRNCSCLRNRADGTAYAGGGGASLTGCLVYNCLFAQNSAGKSGALGLDNSTLYNCTIISNRSTTVSGGVTFFKNTPVLNNCIVYANTPDNYYRDTQYSPAYTITYTCTTPLPGGTRNLAVDPQFVDMGRADYHLQAGSPCINTGQYAAWMADATDLDGSPRVMNGAVDLGCYEFGTFRADVVAAPADGVAPLQVVLAAQVVTTNTGAIYYWWDFDSDGSNEYQGLNCAVATNVYPTGWHTVTMRLDDLLGTTRTIVKPDLVKVFVTNVYFVAPAGAHVPPFSTWATAATNVEAAVALAYDGQTVWLANGTYRPAAPIVLARPITLRSVKGAAATILDGRNARRLLTFNANAQVEGVTLYRGRADYGGGAYFSSGGILSSAIISNCTAVTNGGGVYMANDGTLDHALVTGCTALNGGGAYLEYNGLVQDCVIDGNRAIYTDNTGIGGGTYCLQGGTVRNCLIMRNYGSWLCGGAYAYYSMLLENCTIVSNDCFATSSGVGAGSPSIIRNCIVMYNKTNANTRQITGLGNGSSMMYNNCSDTNMVNCPASRGGNIDANPQFDDWSARDFHLLPTSPCINTGSNALWMTTALDIEGNPRIYNSIVDMGCYEYVPEPLGGVLALVLLMAGAARRKDW
ncbi:MAG: S8 family serine peptidase [bacterium]|nr:S8 family serine peptidase [bacterium]